MARGIAAPGTASAAPAVTAAGADVQGAILLSDGDGAGRRSR
jgi:hypothetical protein